MRKVLEVGLLGGVAMRQRGQPAIAAPPRSVALLAYLALHADMPQSRPHLAATFWPDSTESQARTNLRRELHQLRALLGTGTAVVADANTLAWRDTEACRVDVRTFLLERHEALAAQARGDLAALARHSSNAVDEYRGPLLPGWYDEWVLEDRDVLLRQCIDLCDRAVRSAGRGTGDADILALARRRIQLAPLEEPGYRQLMDLQANSGDRAGAMTTYHRCASVLEQELGVSPSAETTEAFAEIIDAGGDLGARTTRSADPRTVSAESARPTVIGREAELRALMDRWQAAAAGEPGLALVTGEPGIGKTRLVAELAAQLGRSGVVVASARCFGASGRLALAPVADWLRNPQLRVTAAALDPLWRDEVERLVPLSSASVDPSVASRAKVDAWKRLRFFEGLARAVLTGNRPTMLVLDDLQWCDSDTMLWLSFLLELAADSPLFLCATARHEELVDNPEVLASLRSLRSAGIVMEIALDALTPAATAGLARQVLGRTLSDADVALLHSATGGTALYIVEALRNLPPQASGSALTGVDVSGVLSQRLSSVSEAASQVAGLASAVGRDFGLELLSEASDLGADSVVRAVDELWRRRILRQADQSYVFSHDLLRDTAYDSLAPAQRWLQHRRLAQALELLHPGHLDEVAAELAHHYARSGRGDRAIPFYAIAAEAATAVFANAEAIQLLRRALDLLSQLPPGRDRDRRELEMLQTLSAPLNARYGYAARELEETLSRLVELAHSLGQSSTELASLVGLWASRLVQGEMAASDDIAKRALELSMVVPELIGQAHFAVAGSSAMIGRSDVAVKHFDIACDLSQGGVSLSVGTRPEVHARAWSAHAHWLLGDVEGAAAARRESVRRAREVQHPYSLVVALAYATITNQLNGDILALDSALSELTELCERYEIAYYREWVLVFSGWRLGGGEGVDRIRAGLANLSAQRALARTPYWLSLLAQTQSEMGDDEAARASLDAARIAAVQRDERWWLPEVLRLTAALQPADRAAQTLSRAGRMARSQSSAMLWSRCQEDLARLGVRASSDAVRSGERSPNA